jgi:hypothetical protein
MPQEVAEMVARRLRNSFSASTLTRLRQMPACDTFALLATYFRTDPTYRPVKDDRSARWHLSTGRGEFEIVSTGPKWYDTRTKRGGGGAIDLAMYLLDLSFVDAVKLLMHKASPHGADHPQGIAASRR